MKKYEFEVAVHEEYGTLGFRPRWYPQGDPLGGMAVAHDILEHFPGDDGGSVGELMALGASLFIRGDGGYFAERPWGNSDESVNIACDIPEVWRHHLCEEGGSLPAPRRCPDDNLRERCEKICGIALTNIDDEKYPTIEDQKAIVSLLYHGYKRAQKRYSKVNEYHLTSLFQEIEKEADKKLQSANEGSTLTVWVDVRNCDVRMEVDGYDY